MLNRPPTKEAEKRRELEEDGILNASHDLKVQSSMIIKNNKSVLKVFCLLIREKDSSGNNNTLLD